MGASTFRLLTAVVSDHGGVLLSGERADPSAWLMLLLVPILLGGGICVGMTLRRVR